MKQNTEITQLTSAQIERLTEFRDKWLARGLATGPCDRPAMEAAIDEAYRCAGKEPPKIKIWLGSPLAGCIGAHLLSEMPKSLELGTQVRDQVRDQVLTQVRAQVRTQVEDQVEDQVWAQIRDQVRTQVEDQVWAQVADQVADQVLDQVRNQVAVQVRNQVEDQVSDQVRGQVGDQLWNQISAQVWTQVLDQVRNQISAQVGDQVEDQVEDQVWAQVGDQVWNQISAQVGDQVRTQVWAQVRKQVSDQVWDQISAQVRSQVRDQVWAQVRTQVLDQVLNQVRTQVLDQVEDQVAVQVRTQVLDQVVDQVGTQVGTQVRTQVRDQVLTQVVDQVGTQVRTQVRAQVEGQVGTQVGTQVLDQVLNQVGDQVRDQIWDQIYKAGHGSHDSGWLAFYDFFGEVCGLEFTQKLQGLSLLSKCGWWWPFEGAVILTERPIKLNRDERGRLHSEIEAAIEYPDGFGVWAVHGVRVEKWIIESPEQITPEKIDKEDNAEVRRVMIDRYGIVKYLQNSGAELVSEDDYGKLWRKTLKGDSPILMVEMINSTMEPDGSFKTYFESVHPELRPLPPGHWPLEKQQKFLEEQKPQEMTARNAIASTFGMTGEEYVLAAQS